ncbi:MAG: hypothetical protein JXA18_15200 [Chitinispirillaceae bacterium]|nr:hypothetical protein [Chitinispirillaceae bacterium]
MKIGNTRITAAFFLLGFNLLWTGDSFSQPADEVQSGFSNPSSQYRMGVRYWWWGSQVTRSELAWQLQQMKDQGIGEVEEVGVYAAASGQTVALGSTQWVSNIIALVEEAAKLGMYVTVNPGTAWPWCYNGPLAKASAASCKLLYESTRLTGPQTWTGAVPKPSLNSDGRLWQVTMTQTARAGSIDPVIDTATIVTQNATGNNTITVTVPSGEWILSGFWLQPVKYGGDPDGPQPDNDGPTVGFEDSGSVHAQLNWLIQPVIDGLSSSLVGTTLKGIYCDNLEDYGAGIGPSFGTQFQQIRGWNFINYLPVFAYKATTDEGKRISAEYNAARGIFFGRFGFGGAREWAAKRGLVFRGEGHDWYYWADNYGNADIPEFEQYGGPLSGGAASAGPLGRIHYGQKARAGANLYGRRVISCESFTRLDGDNDTNNASIKLMNEAMNNIMSAGANKIMMHGYTYVPSNKAWTRNFRASSKFNHWHPFFPLFRGFADYIARNSYVLQQGKPVVEVLSLGSDTSIGYSNSQIKEDPCSEAGFLQNTFTVSNGAINTPMVSYKLLIVKNTIQFVETLRKLDTLIQAGANVLFTNGMVVGTTPYFYGGKYSAVSIEMAEIKSRIYDVITGTGPVAVGSGKVWSTRYNTPDDVLRSLNIKAQVIGPAGWQKVAGEFPFQQRRGDDYDVFFLNNNAGTPGTWRLRATGQVEEWDAATGKINPLNFTNDGEYTQIFLSGNRNDSKIIIVRRDRAAVSPNLDSLYYTTIQTINGTWRTIFTDNFRDPVTTISLTTLSDWTKINGLASTFIGVGSYSLTFNLSSLPDTNKEVVIDLGSLYDIAEVTVNGKIAGYAWKSPFRVFVTGLLKTGSNDLLIRVASRWHKSGIAKGLLGPVTLQVASIDIPTDINSKCSHKVKDRISLRIRQTTNRASIVFSRKDTYRIEVKDIMGRTVNTFALKNNSRCDLFNGRYAPGIYFISAKCREEICRAKLMVTR